MVDWLGVVEIALGATRPDVPVVDRARCLATRYPATACVGCVVACPRGAIDAGSRPEIALDRCDGCGACTAACPTGTLSSARLDEAKRPFLEGSRSEAPVATMPPRGVAIRCDLAVPAIDSTTEAVIPCLGAIRAADIVLAAAAGGAGGSATAETAPAGGAAVVTMARGDCAVCPRLQAVRGLEERVAGAREALAVLGIAASIDIATRGSVSTFRPSATTVSRRGLFGLARAEARRAVVDVARSVEPVHARLARLGPVPEWRVMLGRLAPNPGDPDSPIPGRLPVRLGAATVHVAATCDGCGLCVLACPLGLMAIAGDRAMQQSDGCTACGLCVEICREHAIDLAGVPVHQEAARVAPSCDEVRTEAAMPAVDTPEPASHRADILSAGRLAARASTMDRAMRASGHRHLVSNARGRTERP